MAFIESTYKSVDLQGFWKALCPLAEVWLPSLELQAGAWISGNCFSVPKTEMGHGPRSKRRHSCEAIFAPHEYFHKTAGNLETWTLGGLPTSPALFSSCHLSGPFELMLDGCLEVLGGCRSELCIVLFPALHEESSKPAFRSQATPSSFGFLYKSIHWEKLSGWQAWKCLEAVLCRGMGYNEMGFKKLWDRIIGAVEATTHCSKSQSCCPQLSSHSRCHQGVLSLLVCH